MTSPLERAARALWIASGKRAELWDAPPTALWKIEMDKDRPIYLERASAVLAAIREPSEGMAQVGLELHRRGGGVCPVFTAMIDAALEEG